MSVPTVLAITLLLSTLSVALFPVVDSVIDIGICDLYKGRWVYDESYPLYSESCPFTIPYFKCTSNGRPDFQYQKYRWQPNLCILPRWNGLEFARKMRGKRIMFVGDSIGLNQWQSLACMLLAAHPNASYHFTTSGNLNTIFFPELDITLMYLLNRLIVDIEIENGQRVLKLDSIAVSSREWLPNDVLIFDTLHWWFFTGGLQEWDVVQENNVTVSDTDRFEIYEKVLRTWGRWVDQNVDTSKVKIFFQGFSPVHWNSNSWGKSGLQQCVGEQKPLEQPVEDNHFTTANNILKRVIESMNKPVHILDIIELSQFRVDGHPSIYHPIPNDTDCTHWCLPGVPDTWNQLLYAALSFSLI